MLQSSEYKIEDYLKWLARTSDFRKVMRRRQLDYTKKASLLLALVWLVTLLVYVTCIFLLIRSFLLSDIFLAILSIMLFVFSPQIIAYGIIIPLWLGKIFIQGPKQRKIIASAEKIFANHSALKIAIAGSYGKTSAKEIISTVLSEGKKVAFTPGNMNTAIGISRFAQTLDGSEDIIIVELGEEKVGDVRELCELTHPDVGVITGINEAHLSSFGTLENTIATIFEIKDYLGYKTIYKNSESPLVAQKITKGDNFSYSQKGTNNWQVTSNEMDIKGTSFIVKNNNKTISAHTDLLGVHNIGIITVAIDIADSVGLTIPQIISGIKNTKPFEHRMQPKQLHGAWVIDDTYNGNSEGVKAGLKLLKELDAKRRIYVTPGLVEQGDKNREVHEQIGQQIAKVADVVVLMQNSVTKYIENGLKLGKFKGKLITIDDPLEFYTNLDHFIVSGDVVLMQNDWTDNFA